MELKEAYDIIDATIGMFHSIMYEIDNGKLKEDFLLTPVYSCVDTIADEHLNFELQSKEYYIYKDGDKIAEVPAMSHSYIVDDPDATYYVATAYDYRGKRVESAKSTPARNAG